MTGQFLTLCLSVAAIIAICDYFIAATKVGEGMAVYYVLHIILCLPIFIEGRGILHTKGVSSSGEYFCRLTETHCAPVVISDRDEEGI